jgi:hypothetical protein
MDQDLPNHQCTVCAGPNFGAPSICAACEEAFESAGRDVATTGCIDLNHYSGNVFPWEPSDIAPRLLSSSWSYLIICVGLILIVVLLSFLRTPLPTCWEISS